jgi:protein Cut8
MLTYLAPSSPFNTMSSGRKRKATDELQDDDTRMSQSPSSSPSLSNSQLPSRVIKRPRKNLSGRPLALPRLLETLSAEDMRTVLRQICDSHPDIAAEVLTSAPRPSAQSTLSVLQTYENNLRQAMPFGVRESSEYAYNRVKQHLLSLLDALKDFTPQFLPPHETQTSVSLEYLDAVTEMVHRLPNWESYAQNRHKYEAYEELAKAWATVVREAGKRAGGFQLQLGGWDHKLQRHNAMSGGKMEDAVQEMRHSLGWMGSSQNNNGGPNGGNDSQSIRQQLFSGTYGLDTAVRVGPW